MSGTIALVGPSTVPGAPQITPAALDVAVNAALVVNAATAAAAAAAELVRAQAAEAANAAVDAVLSLNTAAITAETAARAAADAAEVVARNGAIAVETARAMAAEVVAAAKGGSPASTLIPLQPFAVDGVAKVFSLVRSDTLVLAVPNLISELMIFVNGYYQKPATDFTFSGSTVTFTVAPPSTASASALWMTAPLSASTWPDVIDGGTYPAADDAGPSYFNLNGGIF